MSGVEWRGRIWVKGCRVFRVAVWAFKRIDPPAPGPPTPLAAAEFPPFAVIDPEVVNVNETDTSIPDPLSNSTMKPKIPLPKKKENFDGHPKNIS